MASEPTDGGNVSVVLPDDMVAWLDERAEDLGLEREDLLQRLLVAYQVATTAEGPELDAAVDAPALEARLDRLERDYQEGLEDVRKRVLQLKTATEAKADADHPAFERIDRLDDQVSALVDEVEEVSDRLDQLPAGNSMGDAPEDATGDAPDAPASREEIEDVRDKLSRVARAVVALRDDERATPTGERGADAAERLLDLKRTAAREGHETATCGACGETVHVSLLPEPACPACHTAVGDLVTRGGFRKRATLVERGGGEE